MNKLNKEPLVSIIIPTKNSAETINICLKSIRDQTYSQIEIIVVDNYSQDGTREIADQYAKVYRKGPERSVQRNFGAEKAGGRYLLFIDSDMELTSQVVEECIKEIQKRKEIKGLVIPEISVGEGFWARCKALERSCYIGDEIMEAARFFEKEIFKEMKGYDERIAGGGEEYDLPQRIKEAGYKITRIPSHIIHHEGHLTLWDSIKKKFYYAQTIDFYRRKHPDLFAKQATIFRPAFFRHWKRLMRDPIHTLGFIFMKTCEFSAGGLGYLKNKCWRSGNRDKFRKFQKEYDKIHKRKGFREEEEYYEVLGTLLKGKKTLDIGCGYGFIEKYSPNTVGVDFSFEALLGANKRGVKRLVQASAEKLPFGDDQFDVSLSSGVLEHIINQEEAVREMVRVSRIQINIVHAKLPYGIEAIRPLLMRILGLKAQPVEKPLSLKEVKRLLRKNNSRVIVEGVWNYVDLRWIWSKIPYGIVKWPSHHFIISTKTKNLDRKFLGKEVHH